MILPVGNVILLRKGLPVEDDTDDANEDQNWDHDGGDANCLNWGELDPPKEHNVNDKEENGNRIG